MQLPFAQDSSQARPVPTTPSGSTPGARDENPDESTDDDKPATEPSFKKNREWLTWQEEIAEAVGEGQSLGYLFGGSFVVDNFREYDYVFHVAEDVKNGCGEILITGDLAKGHILSADEVFSLV